MCGAEAVAVGALVVSEGEKGEKKKCDCEGQCPECRCTAVSAMATKAVETARQQAVQLEAKIAILHMEGLAEIDRKEKVKNA